MAYRSGGLPERFPVGTKLVIEGRPRGEGQVQIISRFLEFPDGTFVRLPVQPMARKRAAVRRTNRTRSRRR